MKQTIRTILCTAAFAVPAVSCQMEIDGAGPVAEAEDTIEISIGGLMGEYAALDASKSSLTNTVRVSWEDGDIVYVYDGTQNLGSLVATLGEGGDDRYALLSTDDRHIVKTPASGTTMLTLVHSPLLSKSEAPAVSEGVISISLADQSGEKAPFVAYAVLDYNDDPVTMTNAVVPFKLATSVIRANCTGLKAGTAIDGATLSNVNTACSLTLSGTAAPTVAGNANGTITRTNDSYFSASKVNAEGEAVFQMAVPVLSSGVRCLTLSQGSDLFEDGCFSQSALGASTSVNTVCQLVEKPQPLKGVFTVDAEGKQVRFSQGNLYFDGSRFAFETDQYGFHGYDAESNVWGLFGWSTSATDYGKNASLSAADYSGDFADWGNAVDSRGTWRTLTKDEWKYLSDSRSMTNVSFRYTLKVYYEGVMGVVLYPDDYDGSALSSGADYSDETFPEDCVFLPAAGLREGSDVTGAGYGSCYWSSSASSTDRAYFLYFDDGNLYPEKDDFYRYCGFCVRLVTEVK